MTTLRVTVKEASLPVKGTVSAFVTVKLQNYIFKTQICKNSNNPTWNETFSFDIPNPQNKTLEVNVENKGLLKPTPIGHVYVRF